MNNILIIFLIVISVTLVFTLIKYISLRKDVNKYLGDVYGKSRYGYYDTPLQVVSNSTRETTSFIPRVFVNEVHKYKNGESEIKINSIDCNVSRSVTSHFDTRRFIRNNFNKLVKSNSITWLEEDDNIKALRKSKLEKLNKKFKKK